MGYISTLISHVEVLMGYSVGLSDSYYKATESELLNDYLKAIDMLTKVYPPLNQSQTIELDEIVQPFKRPNATDLKDALRGLQGVG